MFRTALALVLVASIPLAAGCERCAGPHPAVVVETQDADGVELTGATVTLDGEPCEMVLTHRFECAGYEGGDAELVVTADGYEEHAETVAVVEGGDPKCPSFDTVDVTVQLVPVE